MVSESDQKKGKSACATSSGGVVDDDSGRRVWRGTIREVKLSLVKTGRYLVSRARNRQADLSETPERVEISDSDEEKEISVDIGGYDPRDSTR